MKSCWYHSFTWFSSIAVIDFSFSPHFPCQWSRVNFFLILTLNFHICTSTVMQLTNFASLTSTFFLLHFSFLFSLLFWWKNCSTFDRLIQTLIVMWIGDIYCFFRPIHMENRKKQLMKKYNCEYNYTMIDEIKMQHPYIDYEQF